MKKHLIALLFSTLASVCLAKDKIEQNEAPSITHFPPGVAYLGQPIPIYAEVTDATGKIKKVSLSYALSQQQVPVEVPMKKVSGNRYSGLIPANFFASMSKVWYFVSATDSFDERQDTTWYPVLIKKPDAEKAQPDQAATGESPAQAGSATSAGSSGRSIPPETKLITDTDQGGIGKGTVLVGLVLLGGGGAAVALADGGGSGDGGGGFTPTGGAGVVRSASGSSSRDTPINFSSAAGGKPIAGVRVTIQYDAKGTPDQFQAIYEGRVIADSGVVSGAGTVQGSGSGTSSVCTIRVNTGGGGGFYAGSSGHHPAPAPTPKPKPKPTSSSDTWSFSANVEVSTK